jgi:hypothetical protein
VRRLAGALVLSGLAAAGLALSLRATTPSRAPDASRRVVDPGAAALERGLSYLRANRSDLSALVVLDYLQRRYALARDYRFEAMYAGPRDDERLRLWGRIIGSDPRVDEDMLPPLTSSAGIEPLVMHALYCDRIRLPDDYGSNLRRFIARGGYDLTHAVLALKLVRDNDCALQRVASAELEEEARRALRMLIGQAALDPRYEELDTRYEALAVLQDFLDDGTVDGEQFARLLNEQQSDGGWRPQSDQPSRPHPTVLAVWALLARSRPSASRISFARGP